MGICRRSGCLICGAPICSTSAAYQYSVSGNLGTRLTSARVDSYWATMNMFGGASWGPTSPRRELNLPSGPRLAGAPTQRGICRSVQAISEVAQRLDDRGRLSGFIRHQEGYLDAHLYLPVGQLGTDRETVHTQLRVLAHAGGAHRRADRRRASDLPERPASRRRSSCRCNQGGDCLRAETGSAPAEPVCTRRPASGGGRQGGIGHRGIGVAGLATAGSRTLSG